jgi:hypothetical protein
MLTKPGETRFATVVIGLECLKRNREALVATHVRAEVMAAVGRCKNQRSTETGMTLEEQYKESKRIVNDDYFWDSLEGVRASVSLLLLHCIVVATIICRVLLNAEFCRCMLLKCGTLTRCWL